MDGVLFFFLRGTLKCYISKYENLDVRSSNTYVRGTIHVNPPKFVQLYKQGR